MNSSHYGSEGNVIVLLHGRGGHGAQGDQFRKLLADWQHTQIEVVTERLDNEDIELPYVGGGFVPRLVNYEERNRLREAKCFVRIFIAAFFWLAPKRARLQCIVSFGPAFCVPILLAAQLLRLRSVHFESWSRFDTTSRTTALLRCFGVTIVRQNFSSSSLHDSALVVGRVGMK